MDGVTAAQISAPFHATSPLLGPLSVLDCAAGREARGGSGGGGGGGGTAGGSVSNADEAQLAARLYHSLVQLHPEFGGTVAVLTP